MAEQTKAVLREMDQAEERAAQEVSKIDKDLQHSVMTLSTWRNQEQAAEAKRGWEQEAEQLRYQVDERLTKELRELRRKGEQSLETDTKAIQAAVYTAKLKQGPQGAEAWAEAGSRAQFVQEDLKGLQPAQIVARFEQARTAGDTVGAWLIQRYGREILEAGISERAQAGDYAAIDKHMALDELNRQTEAELGAEERRRLDELHTLKRELSRNRTQAEERALRQKYGIKSY